ncbi:prolyl oligopeptidase family serine peptidase [Asticcacaulis solisilvae]|uniref:prolyl oligopeptidase family serine peptidase n=1 Tax=Asticcacaulis solisilvae TaxID=1217274 RepID=UPI003FD8D255
MHRHLALLTCLAFALGGCVSIPKMLYGTPQTTPLSQTLKSGAQMRYIEYVPPSAKPGDKLPLIIVLHGSGEAGGDTYSVLANGPWHYANEHPDFPFLMLAPQMDRDGEWDPEALNEWLSAAEKTLATQGFSVDRRRVYLTGLSRGGQGTWDFAMRHPRRFAAIAPVAAYSDVNEPCRLKAVPVWVFHGANDHTVPTEKDQKLVDDAKACGVDVRLTIYPDTGHDSWSKAYADPELYSWFLSHRKRLLDIIYPVPRAR